MCGGHPYIENVFIIYLKFKFNGSSFILSDNLTPDKIEGFHPTLLSNSYQLLFIKNFFTVSITT